MGTIKFANGVVGVLDINWLTPTKIRELSVLAAQAQGAPRGMRRDRDRGPGQRAGDLPRRCRREITQFREDRHQAGGVLLGQVGIAAHEAADHLHHLPLLQQDRQQLPLVAAVVADDGQVIAVRLERRERRAGRARGGGPRRGGEQYQRYRLCL